MRPVAEPMLLRGGRLASRLHCPPSLPLGLGDAPSSVAKVDLEPGDAVLFFTDGIIQANSPVRRLARAVRTHREGRLADDATIVFVDWHPKIER